MPQYCYSLSERGDKSLTDSKRNRVPNGANRSYNFFNDLDFSKKVEKSSLVILRFDFRRADIAKLSRNVF